MKPKTCQIVCTACHKVTGMSRGAHSSANEKGVYITCYCDFCSTQLVVKVADKDSNLVPNVVIYPRWR